MIKNLLIGLLLAISGVAAIPAHAAGVDVGGWHFEYNILTSKWDLYPSTGFFYTVAQATNAIASGGLTPNSTNYIHNGNLLQPATFYVSSGTAVNFFASTITVANLVVDGTAVFPDTITAHTIRATEIFTSTINPASPLRINQINVLNFADGTNQFTAATAFSSAAVIMNTANYEPKQFNISSATVAEISITTGTVKLVSASIEMNNNVQYLSQDKQSYTYYDSFLNAVRFFVGNIEAYRIEK